MVFLFCLHKIQIQIKEKNLREWDSLSGWRKSEARRYPNKQENWKHERIQNPFLSNPSTQRVQSLLRQDLLNLQVK